MDQLLGGTMSSVIQQRLNVEQLQAQVHQVNREPMTKTLDDLVNYIQSRHSGDPFLVGIDKKENPFMEKGGCVIL